MELPTGFMEKYDGVSNQELRFNGEATRYGEGRRGWRAGDAKGCTAGASARAGSSQVVRKAESGVQWREWAPHGERGGVGVRGRGRRGGLSASLPLVRSRREERERWFDGASNQELRFNGEVRRSSRDIIAFMAQFA